MLPATSNFSAAALVPIPTFCCANMVKLVVNNNIGRIMRFIFCGFMLKVKLLLLTRKNNTSLGDFWDRCVSIVFCFTCLYVILNFIFYSKAQELVKYKLSKFNTVDPIYGTAFTG